MRREESARQLEEADEPKTPEASPNKSGEWRESDSGMEWVIDSAKKGKSTEKKGPNKPGADDKDLDNEETFTKGNWYFPFNPFMDYLVYETFLGTLGKGENAFY